MKQPPRNPTNQPPKDKKDGLHAAKPVNLDVLMFGLETLAVGIYFLLQHPFKDDPADHFVHLSFLLPSPPYCLTLAILGVLVVVCSAFLRGKLWAVLMTALAGVWTLNVLALYTQAVRFGHGVSVSSVLAFFVLVRVILSASVGRWYR